MILEIKNLRAGYFNKEVLHGVNLGVEEDEIVVVIGHNGSGKSTLLKAVFGLLPVMGGTITWQGKNITHQDTSANVREGIAYIPQGGGIFPDLSVLENLKLGANIIENKNKVQGFIDEIYTLFPILKKRSRQEAGTLSTGERQMLSIGMVLVRRPKLILLDEPSLGLAPVLVEKVLGNILGIHEEFGVPMVVVEQKVKEAIKIGTRVYVLRIGEIIHEEKEVKEVDYKEFRKLFSLNP